MGLCCRDDADSMGCEEEISSTDSVLISCGYCSRSWLLSTCGSAYGSCIPKALISASRSAISASRFFPCRLPEPTNVCELVRCKRLALGSIWCGMAPIVSQFESPAGRESKVFPESDSSRLEVVSNFTDWNLSLSRAVSCCSSWSKLDSWTGAKFVWSGANPCSTLRPSLCSWSARSASDSLALMLAVPLEERPPIVDLSICDRSSEAWFAPPMLLSRLPRRSFVYVSGRPNTFSRRLGGLCTELDSSRVVCCPEEDELCDKEDSVVSWV